MNDIPPELLAEVLREVEEEKGCPDEYTVPIEELFERLMAKGWRPDAPLLHGYRSNPHGNTVVPDRQYRSSG